jgi:hypothetical protein
MRFADAGLGAVANLAMHVDVPLTPGRNASLGSGLVVP